MYVVLLGQIVFCFIKTRRLIHQPLFPTNSFSPSQTFCQLRLFYSERKNCHYSYLFSCLSSAFLLKKSVFNFLNSFLLNSLYNPLISRCTCNLIVAVRYIFYKGVKKLHVMMPIWRYTPALCISALYSSLCNYRNCDFTD